jgi:hypothetical protein
MKKGVNGSLFHTPSPETQKFIFAYVPENLSGVYRTSMGYLPVSWIQDPDTSLFAQKLNIFG